MAAGAWWNVWTLIPIHFGSAINKSCQLCGCREVVFFGAQQDVLFTLAQQGKLAGTARQLNQDIVNFWQNCYGGRTGFKRSCACLVVCMLQCVFVRHRKTQRGRAREWQNRGVGEIYIFSKCSIFWKIIPCRATAWGWYELVSVARVETTVLRSRNKTETLISWCL